MTLDPDCVSVRIDNSAASANSLLCKIMLAVKSVLNCGGRGRVMERERDTHGWRGGRDRKRARERGEWRLLLFSFYQGAQCKPAAVLNRSHHPLTAILKQEGAASHCL